MSDSEIELESGSDYSSDEEETPEQLAEKERAEELRIKKVKQDKIDRAQRIADNQAKQLARQLAEREARKKPKPLLTLATPDTLNVEQVNNPTDITEERLEENRRDIERTYITQRKKQDKKDALAQAGLERVEHLFANQHTGTFNEHNEFTLNEKDATPEFLALIEGALETPKSKEEEAQRVEDELARKKMKKIFYASNDADNIPDYPWTEAQTLRYAPKIAPTYADGSKGIGLDSEERRYELDTYLGDTYGHYDPNQTAPQDFLEEESEDDLEEVPPLIREGLLRERGTNFYTELAIGNRSVAPSDTNALRYEEPRDFDDDPIKLENYANQQQGDIRRRIAEQKEQLEQLELARMPSPLNLDISEESEGVITDEEGDAEQAEQLRVKELLANAPAIRPDLEALAKMGQGKHGKLKQRVIFPQMPKSAYNFTTEGKSYGVDTKSFLEQQRDAMLKMKTSSKGKYEGGIQFTSMFPRDSAGNVIDGETDANAQVAKIGLNILPWVIEDKGTQDAIKAEERKDANITQKQRDYDEDKETFLTDKKSFIKKVKQKRLREDREGENYTNTPAFFKSFGLRKKRKKPAPKPKPKPPTPQPLSSSESESSSGESSSEDEEPPPKPPPKKEPAPAPAPVAPPRKRRGLKKKSPPPKRPPPPTRPPPRRPPPKRPPPKRPKTPEPTPTPKPPKKPRPASIATKSKRATRSDKGTHHKWSDGRENSATYKKNKAKGVDWSAVRCRASTCWEVGDRSKDAKGKGAFKKNESSGEYKKQLRAKKKKKKEEKREEDGWF